MKICVICGYSGLKEAPYVWINNKLVPSYSICPCCGFEFGTDNIDGYLQSWIDRGCKWFDETQKPSNWNIIAQLDNIQKEEVQIIISKLKNCELNQRNVFSKKKQISELLINDLNEILDLKLLYENTNDIEKTFIEGYLKIILSQIIDKYIRNGDYAVLEKIISILYMSLNYDFENYLKENIRTFFNKYLNSSDIVLMRQYVKNFADFEMLALQSK